MRTATKASLTCLRNSGLLTDAEYQTELAKLARSAKRAHNCQAESNMVRLSVDWAPDGNRLVSTWKCRKCGNTWCTIWDPAVAEAERLAALGARCAQVAADLVAEIEADQFDRAMRSV